MYISLPSSAKQQCKMTKFCVAYDINSFFTWRRPQRHSSLLKLPNSTGTRATCEIGSTEVRRLLARWNEVDSLGPGKRGHIVADTNVSPFARAGNICCVSGTKKMYLILFRNILRQQQISVSQFAQPKKHHGQQCVRSNVSSITRAFCRTQLFKVYSTRLGFDVYPSDQNSR